MVDDVDEGTGENVGESAPGNSVWMANAVPTIDLMAYPRRI